MSTPTMPTGGNNKDAERRGKNGAPSPNSVWALRIATIAGIPIRLHFTFLLFLVWIGLTGHGNGTYRLLYVITLFVCVALHELGHILVALRFRIPVADITLYPIGGVSRIEKQPTPLQELWVTVAGPSVNVAIAVILWGVLLAQGPLPPLSVLHAGGGGWRGFVEVVMLTNVLLALFNVIPAFPMDGGRILRALLGMYMPVERATAIAAGVGQFIAILFGLWAAFTGQWLLLFIAFFIYVGAGQETLVSRQTALLEGVKVHQAMIRDVRTLTVGNTLKEAADILLDTSQHDFPVLHGDEVQGVLTRNGLLRALAQEGPGAYVAGAMDRQYAFAGPDDDLGEMLPRLQGDPGPLVVLDSAANRHLLGIVTGENVQEFFAVRQIVAARNGAERPPQ